MRFLIYALVSGCKFQYRQTMRLSWFWQRSIIRLNRFLAWWIDAPQSDWDRLDDLMEQVLRFEAETEFGWEENDDRI